MLEGEGTACGGQRGQRRPAVRQRHCTVVMREGHRGDRAVGGHVVGEEGLSHGSHAV